MLVDLVGRYMFNLTPIRNHININNKTIGKKELLSTNIMIDNYIQVVCMS